MSNSDSKAQSSPRRTAGFPIAALALLITACACLLISADLDRLRKQYELLTANGDWTFASLCIAAGVLGGFVGLISMLFSRTTWRVRILSIPAGILAGQAGLFVMLAPGPIWRTIFAVAVLLGASVLFRLGAD